MEIDFFFLKKESIRIFLMIEQKKGKRLKSFMNHFALILLLGEKEIMWQYANYEHKKLWSAYLQIEYIYIFH